MQQLARADFRKILKFASQLYAVQNHQNLIDTIVKGLQGLIPGEIHSYTETNHRENTAILQDAPGGPVLTQSQQEAYAQFSIQHPIIAYYQKTGDGQALTISDLLPFSKWQKTDLYNHVYLPHRMRYCLGGGLTVSNAKEIVMAFGIHREKRNFSERDRTLLNLLHPHFLQAYGNSMVVAAMERRMAALTTLLDQIDQGVMEIDEKGRILWATDKADDLLQKFENPNKNGALCLPHIVWNWLQRCSEQLSDSVHVPGPIKPLMVYTDSSNIRIRFTKKEGTTLLFFEEHFQGVPLERLYPLNLTKRETEVLKWLAEGKSNFEIAKILGIGIGTVRTHLERIYVKLGVEHRHAAITVAYNILTKYAEDQ